MPICFSSTCMKPDIGQISKLDKILGELDRMEFDMIFW